MYRLLLLNLIFVVFLDYANSNVDEVKKVRKILQRKKRYLIFPEGSSLQLVFCLTMPSIGMGNLFTIGSSASLAWELPHDPFQPFRKHSELLHRLDENVAKLKFVDRTSDYKSIQSYWPQNYNSYKNGDYWRDFYETHSNLMHQVHRRTRRDLYTKIEKILTKVFGNGKECLLKSICEVSSKSDEKGSFLEEILKVLLKSKPHENYKNEDEFDVAFNAKHENCTILYPNCSNNDWFHKIF